MLYIPAGARCRKGAKIGCLCGFHADNEPSDWSADCALYESLGPGSGTGLR